MFSLHSAAVRQSGISGAAEETDRMNRSLGAAALKRKRPETVPHGLVDAERAILNSIKSKKDLGIWVRDIKVDTKLNDHVVNKSLKSLMAKNLVKEVVNIQNKGKKHYMAVEFEPSKEISGGEWYIDGNLDKELIYILQDLCLRCIRAQRVATLQRVHNELKKNGVINFEISAQQVVEILNSMVLDDVIIEVKSTGLEDYHSIPIGTICYRVASGAGVAKGSKEKSINDHTLWDDVGAYCFAAVAALPEGFRPLFAISSPSFMIGIPSMHSITRTRL